MSKNLNKGFSYTRMVIAMDMRSLGNIVSKRPVITLIVVLIVTAIFGVYASQMQMSADLKTFLPNDEMVNAQEKISDEFGDTDFVEVIFKSSNALNKSTLLDMLHVEGELQNDSTVRSNLKTPDDPSQSLMSPADVVVMGNITLGFQNELIKMLGNMSQTMGNMNFTLLILPLKTINGILKDYWNIYANATEIRDDAKSLVMMLFIRPQGNENASKIPMYIMENASLILMNSSDFSLKSRALTVLTPPIAENNTSGNVSENPLMTYFEDDMNNSNLNLSGKRISVHYFSAANNFTYFSLNYTNSSLSGGIEEDKQLMNSLNYTKASILMNDNKTALDTMNQTIYGVSQEIKYMESVLPYYISYNQSLSQFLYDFNQNSVSSNDILSVEENTSEMIKITTGDFQKSLMIFNDTFHNWIVNAHIFYDTVYEANSTQQACEGFIQNYYSTVALNNTLTYIKMQINHNSTQNTTNMIDSLVYSLNQSRAQMEEEKMNIEYALSSFQSPYFQWFERMLIDMEYVLHYPQIGYFEVNIFNLVMSMQNQTSNGTMSSGNVFYALKDAFDSGVADLYKYEIQDMFLKEMSMTTMPNLNFSVPSSGTMHIPDMNPSLQERREIIRNMTQDDIEKTIKDVENYNASELLNSLNRSLPVIRNISSNMSVMQMQISEIVKGVSFVYNTTNNLSVRESLEFYRDMEENITNASMGFQQMNEYLPHISGFTYLMTQLSGNIKSMFSKDFNGRSAKAAMMIVMLNSTYLPGETTEQHSARMEKLEERVENIATKDSKDEVMVMGTYLITKATEKTANETMNVLLPVAMILVVIILLITFRSIWDTLWGILGLGMAILWAYGFGVMMGYSFNQMSTTVAVLLVGLGIDYAIHTILRYREELRKGRNVRDAMNEMITHLGMGLVLATITTIAAFLSNVISPIPPIQDFGIMNAVGIFGAFVIFTTAIPAIKILMDEHREKKGKLNNIKKEKEERVGSGIVALNKFMSLGAKGAEHHRYIVITIIGIITLGAIFAGLNVNTTFDIKEFLPSNLPISNTIQFMMDNFNTSGMNDNYVLIEGNITSSDAIKAVKMTMENMKDDDYIDLTQSQSITTYIDEWKEKNTTFAKMVIGNDTDHDGYPDKNITVIYNWLYEHGGAESILHRSDGKYNSMLIIVRSTASTDQENKKLYNEMVEDIKPINDSGLKATITGENLLTYHILDLLKNSQWNSLIVTIVASLIVLVAVFYYESRSWILGVITTIPVIIAMLWLIGTMYLLNISFNVLTVTTTSLTIGLGITYSIHITHRFLEDWRREERIEEAIGKTVRHTGTAIFGAAATTMAGFGTLMLSSMPPIRQFGEIATLSILYSFILAVFILPSFLYVWAERRKEEEV